jgi:outer membrane protein assembly factor BamB
MLHCVGRATGTPRWTAESGTASATPPVRGRAVFVAPRPAELLAFNTETGDKLYAYKRTSAAGRTAVEPTRRIFFASGRTLSAFAPHADGYGLAWSFEATGRITVGPLVHGDAVYIGDERGQFYRLEASD